ncbi:MAG: amidohydrolase family protein, partial [Gammaproteobacteria bacterium]|nr:amidohydrolase family protein [Gammaproteobacteria bacterium]
MKMKSLLIILFAACATLAFNAQAAEKKELPQTLFTNVNIFNGTENKLYENHQVLVEGNLIRAISESAIETREGATVIDGGGRTLMPGFIEAHAHLMLPGPTLPAMEANSTWEDLAIHGTKMAEMYLMQGFTTVRDAGGANAGLRRAIDAGTIIGPRYYPSAAFLSTRGGHADFANFTAPPGEQSNFSRL